MVFFHLPPPPPFHFFTSAHRAQYSRLAGSKKNKKGTAVQSIILLSYKLQAMLWWI